MKKPLLVALAASAVATVLATAPVAAAQSADRLHSESTKAPPTA